MTGQRGWVKENAATLLSLLVMLCAFAVAWGTVTTKITALQKRMDTVEHDLKAHHENADIHVDKEFKSEVRTKLESITQLIHQHVVSTLQLYQDIVSSKKGR